MTGVSGNNKLGESARVSKRETPLTENSDYWFHKEYCEPRDARVQRRVPLDYSDGASQHLGFKRTDFYILKHLMNSDWIKQYTHTQHTFAIFRMQACHVCICPLLSYYLIFGRL